jgi:hypothetical protein
MNGIPPPGARDNGLHATNSWMRLGECDPRLTTELLADLASNGIPAYAQPFIGDVGSYLEVRAPHRPMDRLYVDRARHAAAAALVHGRLGDGEPPQVAPVETPSVETGPVTGFDVDSADTDALFAAIVADFHGPDGPPPAPPADPARRPRQTQREPGLLDPGGLLYDSTIGEGTRPAGEDPFDGDDEHFERPPAEPAPPLHAVTRAALAALCAGIVLLVLPAFVSLSDTEVTNGLGAVLVAAGAVALLSRLRDQPPDDHDDGAVV